MLETGNREWDDPEAEGRRGFLRKAFCFLGTAIVAPKILVASDAEVVEYANLPMGLTFKGAQVLESQYAPLSQLDLINQIATKHIVPGIVDEFFRNDPFVAFVKDKHRRRVYSGAGWRTNELRYR